ncbi:MAG: DNA polymerase I [Acidimicrobiales bacterium]|nr:DNA polymerase I [Acidimicrobiales bacterium]
MPTVLLIDGNSLAYRAFFALPTDMATASGQVTNAVFGFTSMLINLLKDHRPDRIAVAFDLPEPTFRHELVADYKAGRVEAPDILRQQMGLVRQVVDALRIPTVEAKGFEADDVIATLATRARDRGDEVIVVTGDRDVYQLVEDPGIKVLYNRRGVSDYALYDEAGIKERTGVTPAQYIDYAALRGDTSDNLPGVPGVGEKTAARLINDYGDLDGVFANLEHLTPKLRQSLAGCEARVRTNATAIALVRDVPLPEDPDQLQMGAFDADAVRQLFGFLEFRTLWDRLLEVLETESESLGEGTRVVEAELRPCLDATSAVARLEELLAARGGLALEPVWTARPGRSDLLGLALAPAASDAEAEAGHPGEGGGEPAEEPPVAAVDWLEAGVLADGEVRAALARLVGPGGVEVSAHHAKELMRGLAPMGVEVASLAVDPAVAAYLLDPAEGDYSLDDVAARYANLDVRPAEAPPPGQLDLSGSAKDPAQEAARRAVAVAALAAPMRAALGARRLSMLYEEVERPLVGVLARMEVIGVRVDVDYLRRLIAGLTVEVDELAETIQDLAGERFLVNSTQQLRRILYEKLGLSPQRRTKTGYSTDANTLERLRGQHPIIDALLRYREVEKLRSTYGESLLAEVAGDGRIHASFNQTVARTGRLSSDQPNLHNIPVRSEEGRQFRRAFIPAEGFELLVADYNQIELRVIAHLASDPGLIEAFETRADVHRTTASRVFGVSPPDVTPAQRDRAKMVSYGLAYGMEAYGLSQRLGISVGEAEGILSAYFAAFPNVRSYMEKTVAEAKARGYTETLFGRRRQIPELSASNFRVRQAGERQAMNAGIQGLAADLFKLALVRLDEGLRDMESRLVLQVHDEVIVEVPPEERVQAEELVRSAMEGAADLRVPLDVKLSWGPTWADAKG